MVVVKLSIGARIIYLQRLVLMLTEDVEITLFGQDLSCFCSKPPICCLILLLSILLTARLM